MSPKQRTLVTLTILLALTGVVGLYAWKGVYVADQVASEKKAREERVLPAHAQGEQAADGELPTSQLVRLSITYAGETTVLERRPPAPWRIVAPVTAKVDTPVVDALTRQLETARFRAALEEDPDPPTLERYGLTRPTFIVEAVAEVGQDRTPRTFALEGGLENTFDGATFLRRRGEKGVYTVAGGLRFAVTKRTFDLRDKRILAPEETQLQRLEVKTPRWTYRLGRDAEGRWAFERPFVGRADAALVASMLADLASERVRAFLAEGPAARSSAAFSPERLRLDATFTAKDGAVSRLRLARPSSDAKAELVALREDGDAATLAEVDAAAAGHLDRDPAELRDRTLVRFEKERVTRIVLARGDQAIVLAKDSVDASAEAWRVLAPRAGKAKVFKVTSLLWTLGNLRAAAWGEEHPKDWRRYGLDASARSVALFGPDGVELGRLVIGKELVGAKRGSFYVRGLKDQVAECEGSGFSELQLELADVLESPAAADGVQGD